MKKLISLAVLSIVAAYTVPATDAAVLTPAQAKARVEQSAARLLGHDAQAPVITRLAHTANTVVSGEEMPMVYVFAGVDNKGLYVTAADDRFPAVLGYSDSSEINTDDLPPAFVYWMDFYANRMAWAIENGVCDRVTPATGLGDLGGDDDDDPSSDTRQAISPIVKTGWNQNSPYNLLCPKVGTSQTYTGCVATSMSQAIKANQHPTTGIGSYAYIWNGQTLSFNYGTTTFDWANMTNKYNSSASTASKNAVATLMYACGVGVNMSYGTSASGAFSLNIPRALVRHFGYDPHVTYLLRDYFSATEWTNMVYDELAAGRAIIYGGVTKNREGHSFICDGYQNGRFHFNWGWGNSCDGYYYLDALEPDSQGIGGAASGEGFNFDQDIVTNMTIGVAPDAPLFAPIYGSGSFQFVSTTGYFNFGNSQAALNESGFDFVGRLGVKAVNDATGDVYYFPGGEVSMAACTTNGSLSGQGSISAPVNRSVPAGTYTVTPVCQRQGTKVWQPIYVKNGNTGSLTMRMGTSGNFTFDGTDPDDLKSYITVTTTGLPATMDLGTSLNLPVTINNSNVKKTVYLYVLLTNTSTGEQIQRGYYRVDAARGTTNVTLSNLNFGNVDANYEVRFVERDNWLIVSDVYHVTVGNPAGVDEIEADNTDAPVEYFNLQGVRVENPSAGLYIRRQGSSVEKVIVK